MYSKLQDQQFRLLHCQDDGSFALKTHTLIASDDDRETVSEEEEESELDHCNPIELEHGGLSSSDDSVRTSGPHTAEQTENTHYIALSYTWGNAPVRHGRPLDAQYTWVVNGETVSVQENLHDALTLLVPEAKRHNIEYLYIDALCINQADLVERSHQIRLMRRIYEKARMVWGWLGLPQDETSVGEAVELSLRLEDAILQTFERPSDIRRLGFIRPGSTCYQDPGEAIDNGWEGLLDIFQRRYWSRTWIWQEATGPAETWFWCGHWIIDRLMLKASSISGIDLSQNESIDMRLRQVFGFDSVLWRLFVFRENDGSFANNDRSYLSHILHIGRGTSCSDPRDHVYALSGLATDLKPGELEPDYTKPMAVIYQDVACLYLAKWKNLAILQCVQHQVEQSCSLRSEDTGTELPSWVPDWRVKSLSDLLLLRYNPNGERLPFDAVPTGAQLHLSGVLIDSVSELSTVCNERRGLRISIDALASWSAMVENDRTYDSTGETLGEAFRATVVADTVASGELGQYARGGRADLDLLARPSDLLTQKQGVEIEGVTYTLPTTCYGRRLFFTKAGYMGVGPAAMRLGDQAACLAGGIALYIVRDNNDGTMMFIGECYVHGLMDGQVFDLMPERKVERIVLK